MAKVMVERTRMILELLPKLVLAVAANEETQHRFRTAVLIRLSKIETMVSMIHGAQIVETNKPIARNEEKLNKHAEEADEFVSRKSNELGLAMAKFIYGQSEVPDAQRKARRRRSQ